MKKAMKKIAAALVFGAVTLASTAAFAQIPYKHMAIGNVHYGATISEVEAMYGKPHEIESEAKAHGNEVEYKYSNGLEVKFVDGIAKEITLDRPSILKTTGGIKIGYDIHDVERVYGKPDFIESDGDYVYRYEDNPSAALKFEVKGGVVKAIEVGDL